MLCETPPRSTAGCTRRRSRAPIEALNRTRRQQQPLEPVVPDPHPPDPDRRAPPWTVAGRQKLKLAPGHTDHRLAGLGPDARGAHGAGGPQRCERTAALNQATLPNGPHDRVPAGLPHDPYPMSTRAPKAARNNESHCGCAGQAKPVTRLPSRMAPSGGVQERSCRQPREKGAVAEREDQRSATKRGIGRHATATSERLGLILRAAYGCRREMVEWCTP